VNDGDLLRKVLFLPPQASTVAEDIDRLHYLVVIVTMLGATVVAVAAGYLLIRYRRGSKGALKAKQEGPTTAPLWMEIAVLTFLFGLFIAFSVLGIRQFMRLRIAPEDSMEVYVTGKQWMWKFAYPNGGASVGALYVPSGKPVKLIMTSRDVIHSFFVPDFRIKQDVVPGRFLTVWFEAKAPGRHEILCTEYCGTGHSTMRGEVIALDPADYARWLRGMTTEPEVAGQRYEPPSVVGEYAPAEQLSLVRQGEIAASRHGCLRCHTLDGVAHIGPTWAGAYGSRVPLEDGTSVVFDEAYATESMMDPQAKLHRGFQAIMPSYLGLLEPADTAAILELIKALRDVRAEPVRQMFREAPPGAPGEERPAAPPRVPIPREGVREAEPGTGAPAGEIGAPPGGRRVPPGSQSLPERGGGTP
jgi:cytochrome c oxidase subunit 2